MDRLLKNLFDYQRFSPDIQLSALIARTEQRYASALSDDEMGLVSAAGVPELPPDNGGAKRDGQ